MDLNDFLNAFNAADLKEVFPDGNRSPAAAVLRYRVYISETTTTAAGVINDLKRIRSDPSFQSGVGHKRNAMIATIAVLVSAVKHRNLRELTAQMQAMIDIAFPEVYRREFVKLLTSPVDSTMKFNKDGVAKDVKVCHAMSADGPLCEWALSAWAPMRH